MRAVVQRARWARVLVEDQVVGELDRPGLVALVGAERGDDDKAAIGLAHKLWHLRILADEEGRMNRSPSETRAPILVVSQFTVYGDASRGRRPSWERAAAAATAELLVERMVEELEVLGANVETGRFGADMLLELGNDGPVTLIVDVAAEGSSASTAPEGHGIERAVEP